MKHICNIMPPELLKQLLADARGKDRDSVLGTIMMDARVRGERQLLGSIPSERLFGLVPANAEKSICIFDAHNTVFVNQSTKERCIEDSESTDEVVNETFEAFDDTYKFYEDNFARKSVDNKNFPLNAYVHWGNKYMNAFWDGRKMCFGDGNPNLGVIGFTKSVDVIGHELTHGVTEYTAKLEYFNDETHQPGSVNESISDVFGSLIKQSKLNQKPQEADWLIGQIFTDPTKALRSMKDPGKFHQPAQISDYVVLPNDDENDWGGVHRYSGIPNKAFYTAAVEIEEYAWENLGKIWYQTLLSGLSTTCSFQEFADHTVQVAQNTGSKYYNAVKNGWSEVGIET